MLRKVTNDTDLVIHFPSLTFPARLGPKPTVLYHLHKEGAEYVLRCKIPVAEGYKPASTPLPYDKLDTEATKAIATLVSDINGNEPDLTKHPWALFGVWVLVHPQGIAVTLEWQPASVGPRAVSVGNVTPVASSSTIGFDTLRLSSAAEDDETASIMYVVPNVETTLG